MGARDRVKWVPILFLALRAVEARATGRRTGASGFAIAAVAVAIVATILYGAVLAARDLPARRKCRPRDELRAPAPTRAARRAGRPRARARDRGVRRSASPGLLREAARGRARLGLAACLVLVTTPYLAVWYLAWAVPLAAAEDDHRALAACLVLCAYLLPQTIPV